MGLLRLTDKRPDADIDEAVQATIAHAKNLWAPLQFEGEFPVNGFGISNIRPIHVQSTTLEIPAISNRCVWATCQVVSSTFTDWINVTVDEDSYLIITGIFSLEATGAVTEIAATANGVDLPPINIEELYGWDLASAYFTKPFVVKPKSQLKIQLYGSTASVYGAALNQATKIKIGLLGYCVGKRAYLIKRTL